jgi:hypothetical protein
VLWRRFHIEWHEVTAHRIEEIVVVGAGTQTHGVEIPESIIEVAG